MSLSDFMKHYAESGKLRLHTPGHKGRVDPLDITELTDGSFPDAQISECEKYIAEVYGCAHAHMLSGGSSQGVKAAIYYAAKRGGGTGIIDINSHRSVRDGFMLAAKPYVEVGKKGDVRPLTAEDIKKVISRDTDLVVLTSPTYFGYAADIAAIRALCDENGIRLIVDGAHGAHFGFSELLPNDFAEYSDICNLSVHKTLGGLTQSAILLDNLTDAESAELREAVAVMGTTSPSYILYASAENAVAQSSQQCVAEAYARLYDALKPVRGKYPILDSDDFTRVTLDCAALGVEPHELNARLCALGVMSELVTDRYIVFLFTAADGAKEVSEFARALDRCIG